MLFVILRDVFLFLSYENSSWGWSDKKKRDEMTEDKAW